MYSIFLILFNNYIAMKSGLHRQSKVMWVITTQSIEQEGGGCMEMVYLCCKELEIKKFSNLKLFWNGVLCALFVYHLCKRWVIQLAPIVQKVVEVFIILINLHPVDIAFPELYSLDSALSSVWTTQAWVSVSC